MMIMIWEDRFEYLRSKIKEDNKVNLIIIPRVFFSPGYHFILRKYHKKKSSIPLGHYSWDYYRSELFERDRFKFRRYFYKVIKFINNFVSIDMILMPKFNDDWTIDFIQVVNELKLKLFIDDREGAITPQRMLKVPPQLKGINLQFDLMTTQNHTHKEFFLKAGFPDSKVIVNGATQSDYWFLKNYWKDLKEIDSSLRKDLVKILFFSFGERTYMNFYYGDEERTWMPLIKDVNDVLIQILDKYEGKIQVLYKTSAKLNRDISKDILRFTNNAKRHIRNRYLLFLDSSTSSFDLIRHSQLIVGFQTTGMIEAMNIERPIIYTAWGDLYSDIKDTLLPLEDERSLTVCSNKEMFYKKLSEFIENNNSYNFLKDKKIFRKNLIDKYFYNSNGKVCERLAKMIYEII